MNRKALSWLFLAAIVAVTGYLAFTPRRAINEKVDGARLAQLQQSGAWVIDVRTNGEFIQGHIDNALNVPLDQLQQTAAGWSKDQPIVVYCATGGRSAEAASYLAGQGFTQVYDLSGGIASYTGTVSGGQAAASTPTGTGVVKTNGKPVFIDFAGSA